MTEAFAPVAFAASATVLKTRAFQMLRSHLCQVSRRRQHLCRTQSFVEREMFPRVP